MSMYRGIVLALGKLGDSSVAPELLRLLADPQTDSYLCQCIATALQSLARSKKDVEVLVKLLLSENENYVADSLYNTLWIVSRRARVRVLIRSGPTGRRVEIVEQ